MKDVYKRQLPYNQAILSPGARIITAVKMTSCFLRIADHRFVNS